jgi:phage shock protein A
MDDTDLSGLDLAAAKEYIFAFAVDFKRIEKELAQAGSEAETWKGRIALAEGKGLAELASSARSKAEEIALKVAALEGERASVAAKIQKMRAALPGISARERSIDPDRLLAELQLMTGELLGPADLGAAPGAEGASRAATEREFAKLEATSSADAALAAMKRKLAPAPEGGSDEPSKGPPLGGS